VSIARIAQAVERIIGNDEVSGSTPDVSTIIHMRHRIGKVRESLLKIYKSEAFSDGKGKV
jgi:hypothetical protein